MMHRNRKSRSSRAYQNALEVLEPRTLLASTPFGSVDVLSRTTASGWAMNTDDGPGAVNIEITVNGTLTTVAADDFRGDLKVPLGSAYHAFSFTMPALATGSNTVKIQAVSLSTGARTTLASSTLNNPAPIGVLDVNSGSQLAGWYWDSDASAALTMRIDIDGVTGTPFTTNVNRPDVAGAVGASYNLLGFNVTGSFTGHVVEIFVLDAPSGNATRVYTNNRAPIGVVDVNNGVTVSGWTLDQDASTTSINMRVEIDGVILAGTPTQALLVRNDLIGPYGSANHGFSLAIPGLTPGTHTIAVYALDAHSSSAPATLLGQATVTNAAPIGIVDVANSNSLIGWAADPSVGSAAATVKVYVDDFIFGSFTASVARPDLTPVLGSPNHGFNISLSTIPAGSHSITVTVVDDRTSDESEVIIFDNFINNTAPVGSFDSATGTTISGWAFDGDAPSASIAVDIYVDGVYSATTTANQARPDIDAVLPTPNHAFSANLPALSFGTHTIELYAAESQGNVSILLGSKTVTNNRPIGSVDTATASLVTGWAADLERIGEVVGIRVFVNGVQAASQNTSVNRPDLMGFAPFNTVPGFSTYGYSISVTLLSGTNQVDVYAVDKNNNLLTPIGSRSVVV